eukprot:TRINITY_DN49455_c0_g1_i1.p1 TRINITY_DN49455_c0_g1~~TRINITY_DN49455_c0_g1_i1.p1  ORF type:complete len:224 (+),score=34.97 TRINITY_DN49455_c0_g1_i1:37-672(+)
MGKWWCAILQLFVVFLRGVDGVGEFEAAIAGAIQAAEQSLQREPSAGDAAWDTKELRSAVARLGLRDAGCLACEWVSKIFRTTLWPIFRKTKRSARRELFHKNIEAVCSMKGFPDDLSVVNKGGKTMLADWKEEQIKPGKRTQMAIIKGGADVQEGARGVCTSIVYHQKDLIASVIEKHKDFRDVDWREILCQRITKVCGEAPGIEPDEEL